MYMLYFVFLLINMSLTKQDALSTLHGYWKLTFMAQRMVNTRRNMP